MTIEMPILIVEGNDVAIFKTLKKAQNHIEPVDVKNNVYNGYDATGRKLKIDVLNGRVVITPTEEKNTHKKEIEKILFNYLKTMNDLHYSEKKYDLKDLINRSIKYAL